jgi:hypothetical protein
MIYWQDFFGSKQFHPNYSNKRAISICSFWDDFAYFAGDYKGQRKDGEKRFLNIEESNYQKRGNSSSDSSMAFYLNFKNIVRISDGHLDDLCFLHGFKLIDCDPEVFGHVIWIRFRDMSSAISPTKDMIIIIAP